MTPKERVGKIKKILFGATPAPAAATPSVFSYNVDGGAPVFVNCSDDGIAGIDEGDGVFTDAAMTTPYPDGTYIVTGTNFGFTVAGGLVSTVNDADGTGAGTPNETAAAPLVTPADMAAFRAEFGTIKTELAAFKTQFATQQTEFAAAKTTISKQDEVIKQLFEIVKELAAEPVADPLKNPENFKKQAIAFGLMDETKMTPLEKFRASKAEK